jgi:hypothetical protein
MSRGGSTHVLAAARDLTRLELVTEAVRVSLEELARTAPAPADRTGLTLSVILHSTRSAADGPPGLQPREPVLVQEVLETAALVHLAQT